MNNRERFLRAMRCQEMDHPPFLGEGPWPDTLARWRKEGYPEGVSYDDFFGVKTLAFDYAGPDTNIFPHFEQKVLSETATETIKIDAYGRKVRDFKDQTTMPEWLEFPVKNRDDLALVIKEHFDVSQLAKRWPSDWEEKVKPRSAPDRETLLFLDGGCYFGILRNLAGVEYSSYLFYDAPDLVDELFERIHYVCLEGLKRALRVLPAGTVDYLGFGEDIAYKTSTLISPAMFRRFLLPRYKAATRYAREHGLDITCYDSDGNLEPFMNLYFEAGIEGFMPCEVAAGMEPVTLRKRYGKRIKMIGGIDKREIAQGKDAIRKEMKKIPGLIREGGYIPKIDHSVSSDISLDNFRFYIDELKNIYNV